MKSKILILFIFLICNVDLSFSQPNLMKAVELKKEAQTEYNNKNYKSSLNKINKAISLLKDDGRPAPSDMISLRDRAKAAVERQEKENAEAAKKKAAADKARQERAAKEAKLKKEQELATYEPEIRREINKIEKLTEGKVYLITSSKISGSSSENSYFFYYDDKYIIVSIPNEKVVSDMNKTSISFDSYDAKRFDEYVTTVKVKTRSGKETLSFRKGIHYGNVFLGGKGDDLLWNGRQYVNFDQDVHYYYYTAKLHADIEMKKSFEKNYYMPYFQTGRIEKLVDFNFVVKDSLVDKLKLNDFENFSSTSSDKIKVKLVPKGHANMLFVTKKIKYEMLDENVMGSYIGGGYSYNKGFLYFTPKTKPSHYAFMQYSGLGYKTSDALSKIKVINDTYTISKTVFESLYESFNEWHGEGAYRYFTSSSYTTPYFVVNKIKELDQKSSSDL